MNTIMFIVLLLLFDPLVGSVLVLQLLPNSSKSEQITNGDIYWEIFCFIIRNKYDDLNL